MSAPPADLGARTEQNLARHATHLLHGTPGMAVREGADLVIADSGLDDDTFNFVGSAGFGLSEAPKRVAATLADLAATGRHFAWRIGPASTPSNLSALLTGVGFPPALPEPAMWLPLAGWRRPAIATTLRCRVVATVAELTDWAWVLAANWEPLSVTVIRFYETVARRALAQDSPARFVVGYADGRPVATAEVLLHADVVGVYNVSVLASQRGRGFGTAVTVGALGAAVERGGTLAVLTASPEGEPVYRKLGFRVFGQFIEHPLPP